MTKLNLKAKLREITGKKVRRFRKQGLIPAIVYGNKIEPKNLWVNKVDFMRIYESAGESTILELETDDSQKVNVLIHDVQFDPLSGNFFHVDFFQVRMDEKVETEVPLKFVGESEAVKNLGGVLVKSLDTLPVSCLPGDLPSEIEVDISVLKSFGDTISVGSLKLSSAITVKIDPDTVIASVAEPRSEEELAKLEEKVEADVTKVEGVVKETPTAEKPSE